MVFKNKKPYKHIPRDKKVSLGFFSLAILLSFTAISIVSQQHIQKIFAAPSCTPGSECEQGNSTACNPSGGNTGKVCSWTCSATGAFVCSGCSGSCGGSAPPAATNNTKPATNNNGTTAGGVNASGTSTNGTKAQTNTNGNPAVGGSTGGVAGGAPPPPACTPGQPYAECTFDNGPSTCGAQFGKGKSVTVYPNSGPNCNVTKCEQSGNACAGPNNTSQSVANGGYICSIGLNACVATNCTPNAQNNNGCFTDLGACDNACKNQRNGGGNSNNGPSVGTFGPQIHAHLQGIGNGINGDGTPENTNPRQKTVNASLYVLPAKFPQAPAATDTLTYNPKTGLFENPHFNVKNIPAGEYTVLLHVNGYLDRQITGIDGTAKIVMAPEYTSTTGTVDMTPGDIAPQTKGDNIVDIQDYNTLASCMRGKSPVCPDPKIADLNGDGVVDQKDLNLLQSHFGAIGDSFTMQQFVCTSDPTCKSGNSTMQMCPLICKMETIPTK